MFRGRRSCVRIFAGESGPALGRAARLKPNITERTNRGRGSRAARKTRTGKIHAAASTAFPRRLLTRIRWLIVSYQFYEEVNLSSTGLEARDGKDEPTTDGGKEDLQR